MARTKRKSRFVDAVRQTGLIRVLIVLLLAIIGGWLSLALAVSGITRTKNPQAALLLVPTESAALAARADQLLVANPTKASPQINKLARSALAQQGMNAKALRLLGYVAEIRGDRQRAFSIMNMATNLSRREAGAQLWLIEYYAQANDTAKTLKHYNILLSTKPDTQQLLYPRLANAIEDEPVRAALLPYMKQDRPWINGFLSYATGNSKDLTGLVNLIVEAKGYPKNGSERDLALGLIGRLVSEKRFADAQNIYLLIPGAKVARLANPAFDANDRNAQFGAMGWQISDNPDASGGFVAQQGKKEPALAVFANAATTHKVASRLLYLPPGSHRFTAKISQLAQDDGGYIRFQMHCPANAVATPFWISDADLKRPASLIEVPADCPVQFLEIIASGGEGQRGLEATISSIAITR